GPPQRREGPNVYYVLPARRSAPDSRWPIGRFLPREEGSQRSGTISAPTPDPPPHSRPTRRNSLLQARYRDRAMRPSPSSPPLPSVFPSVGELTPGSSRRGRGRDRPAA